MLELKDNIKFMNTTNYREYIWVAGTIALACLAFGAVAFGITSFKESKYPNGQVASISVSGEGEIIALPDIATVTITIRESAKTVPEAQKLAEAKVTKAIEAIESLDVDKKDTKTISYIVNPKYETQRSICPTGVSSPSSSVVPYYCPQGKTIVTGYEVSQTIQIKVRTIDSAGEIIGALGSVNITEISGPEFTIDEIEKVQAEAKEKAIEDARAKAKRTARALGVDLGEIIQFSEDNGGYYPTYYKAEMATGAGRDGVANTVTLPSGESVIKSRVTITYSLD
jgi:uncharacterized protein YggE